MKTKMKVSTVLRALQLESRLKILDVLFSLISVTILLSAAGGILPPLALKFGSLKSLFTEAGRIVESHYHGVVPYVDTEMDRELYMKLLDPQVHQVFIHMIFVIIDQLVLLMGLASSNRVLKQIAITGMVGLAIYEIIRYPYNLWWREEIMDKSQLICDIFSWRTSFVGANSSNLPSFMINYVQQHFQCCGLYSLTEWMDNKIPWDRTVIYDNLTYHIHVPISCCNIKDPKEVPECLKVCAEETPFLTGCYRHVSNLIGVRVLGITAEHYMIVFIILHVLSLIMYLSINHLKALIRKGFRGTSRLISRSKTKDEEKLYA